MYHFQAKYKVMGLLNSTVSTKKAYHTWKVRNIVWVFLKKITLKLLFVLNFTTKNKLTKRKRKKSAKAP